MSVGKHTYNARPISAAPFEPIQQRNPGPIPRLPVISYVLPFTYVRPETLPAFKELKGSPKLEWSQTRLRETLGMTNPSFEGLLKQPDNYFEHRLVGFQGTRWTWISFKDENDPRAKLCRELGAIDFGWLIAQKVLGLEAHHPCSGGESGDKRGGAHPLPNCNGLGETYACWSSVC
ncbi:hypothetical protein Q9L58_007953 [Maublancomyces gigas]|uniref:Uncharacterized protein n=1 Tax=Discina gigas TaxID=1032678 RepID=A0ABR3GB36_9PEZI